ncbi:alpha/beta fold hydrolase [Phaeacidiphilus oryzae]|uniref:alpha/beta fold hydrolase n=1 Tax=Phaeacidiphilus oryzae TaxID=348818 RepID=UPI00068AE6AB|nr:alpha/beta hydrolase [Phaeacidiphilus oryzae]
MVSGEFGGGDGVSYFSGRGGVRLAYREMGEGRPLVLLHGFTGDGTLWLRYGQAQALAERGWRVVLPDFRGHGRSDRPHEAAAYPADVLAEDGLALIGHLGLRDGAYDLGGYSLGARIAVRMLVRGAAPGRALLGGQGLREVQGVGGGAGAFVRRVFSKPAGEFEPGSKEARAAEYYRQAGEDPVALLLALDSVVATPAEELAEVRVPALVAMGREDERAVSAEELVAALPAGVGPAWVPGDHGTAPASAEFTAAVADFLGGGGGGGHLPGSSGEKGEDT